MWENFKKIAEIWGRFVCLGKSATATDSFEAMKVCIATNILQKINSEVLLSLGSCGYRIIITEAEVVTQVGSLCNKTGIHKEMDHVPGFEDIEDIEESENDNIHTGNQVQAGEEEDELANSNSKVGKAQESPRSNESRQVTPSLTRTKTVSFSIIGDSEEIRKATHHLRSLAAQDSKEGSSPISQPPPGFEFESQNSPVAAKAQTNNGMVFPSGNSEQDQQEDVNVDEVPPSKRELMKEPASSNSTEVTSESLKQLAHKSLQFGEILGVKVIGDYEAAVSRTTKPLKKNRGKKRGAAEKRPE
uniref:Uncharacterized protein n=1 Tax=Opuntia streptacantha TaxID=393608 RepID=A0A7C9AUC6_OPUST